MQKFNRLSDEEKNLLKTAINNEINDLWNRQPYFTDKIQTLRDLFQELTDPEDEFTIYDDLPSPGKSYTVITAGDAVVIDKQTYYDLLDGKY